MAAYGSRLNVLSLTPWLWRSHWRNVGKRGVWRNANMMSVAGFSLLILPAFVALGLLAIASWREGAVERSLMLAEIALTMIMATWLFLPMLVGSVSGRGQGLELTRLMQFPLSPLQLFQVGALASLMQPVYWILLLASLLSVVVAGFSPLPLLGVVAAVLLIAGAAIFSWAVNLFLSAVLSSRRGREFTLGFLAFGAAPLWLVITGDFAYEEGVLTFANFDRTFLLFDEAAGAGMLVTLQSWMPAGLVTDASSGAAPLRGLVILTAMLASALWLAVLSLKRQIHHPPETLGSSAARQRSMKPLFGLPAPLGTATAKELRFLTRTLDALMGYVGGIGAAVWMILRPDHAPWVAALVMPAVVFNEMVIPLNSFGLDGQAVDRYRLLPLNDRQVILSKNLAYVLLVLIELGVAVLVAGFVLGPPFALGCLVGTLSVCCLTMAWGNFVSVRSPAAREFFNFESTEQAGGILPILYSLVVWLPPFGLGAWLKTYGEWAMLGGELVLLVITALIWWSTLGAAGRQFGAHAESMREKLAG